MPANGIEYIYFFNLNIQILTHCLPLRGNLLRKKNGTCLEEI